MASPHRRSRLALISLCTILCAACGSTTHRAKASDGSTPRTSVGRASTTSAAVVAPLPHFEHVVVVVEENHSFDEVLSSAAPFISSLAAKSAVMTQSYAVTHPSQPNYLALFSGSTQGLRDDSCPHTFHGDNLGRSLLDAGLSFTGYSEGLPAAGYAGCSSGSYARKHNPWVDFGNLPDSVNQPLTAFPSDFLQLPSVSFVIPDESHDMHSGSVSAGDQWLKDHLAGFAEWASSHDSLLIITADEDDHGSDNRIPTLFYGAHVLPGRYAQHIDHYAVLRTLEDMFSLPAIARSSTAAPISHIWSG